MHIILLRHGHAIDDTGSPALGDAGRWLSGKGRKRTRLVSAHLCEQKKQRPVQIWTSPLVRAVQTAEILAEAAGLTDEVTVRAELATGRDPEEVVPLLAQHDGEGPLVLVGHEPSLSRLAALLLGVRSFPSLKKSGAVGLAWERRDAAKITFEVQPKALRGDRDKE
jgi:phosphohistidine phosphatase